MSEYKQENRARWATVATGWERHVEAMQRDAAPVSMWMVDAIAPQPGHTILEIAAGLGDTGFLAAELIAPGGTLITTDLVPEMLSAAQRRAEQLGIENVRFKQVDAEAIDQPAASLDGVLCRWGYMLMPDAEAALKETRRILKPGARLALAAWADPAANPWSTALLRELVERGLAEPMPPGPGQYAWAEEGLIAEQLENAGFVEYDVDVVDFAFHHPSVRAWWDTGLAMSHRLGDVAARMSPADQEEVVAAIAERVAPYTAEDGSVALPARTWVAAATA